MIFVSKTGKFFKKISKKIKDAWDKFQIKEDMKSLSTKAAESLADKICNCKAEKDNLCKAKKDNLVNLNDIVRDVMKDKKRYYLCIGKVALEKEIEELNRIANHQNIGFTKPVTRNDNSKFGKSIKTGNKAKDKESTTPEPKSVYKALKADFENNGKFVSLGAGGLRGILDPSKFQYYKVVYPMLSIENEAKKIEYLEKLVECKWIANSMFCAAGSAKIYKKALEELRKNLENEKADNKAKEEVDRESEEDDSEEYRNGHLNPFDDESSEDENSDDNY